MTRGPSVFFLQLFTRSTRGSSVIVGRSVSRHQSLPGTDAPLPILADPLIPDTGVVSAAVPEPTGCTYFGGVPLCRDPVVTHGANRARQLIGTQGLRQVSIEDVSRLGEGGLPAATVWRYLLPLSVNIYSSLYSIFTIFIILLQYIYIR